MATFGLPGGWRARSDVCQRDQGVGFASGQLQVGAPHTEWVCAARFSFLGRGANSCGGVSLVGGAVLLVAVLALGVLVPRGFDGTAAVHARAIARHAPHTNVPLAAQGPVSRILGRDDHVYRAARAGGGFALVNPAQHLRAWFDRRGVVIRSGRASLGMRLSG